jgi:hypothetical protein
LPLPVPAMDTVLAAEVEVTGKKGNGMAAVV